MASSYCDVPEAMKMDRLSLFLVILAAPTILIVLWLLIVALRPRRRPIGSAPQSLLLGPKSGKRPEPSSRSPLLTPWPVRSGFAPRRWLLDALAFYRALGFFAVDRALSNEALAEKIEQLHREEWGDFDPTDRVADLDLLRLDPDRVWCDDIGDLALKGNDTYVEILKGWARISRGAFRPEGVREVWTGEGGQVEVRFSLGGQKRMLRPVVYEDGAVDYEILDAVNRWIRGSGLQFEVLETPPFMIVAVTEGEKHELLRRGFLGDECE